MTTRTLKPDRGKASRHTLRSRRQWQSEWDWSRQWQSEESPSALLDPTLHPPSFTDPTGSPWRTLKTPANSQQTQKRIIWVPPSYRPHPAVKKRSKRCTGPGLLNQKSHWLNLKDNQNPAKKIKKTQSFVSSNQVQSTVLPKSDIQIIVFMPTYHSTQYISTACLSRNILCVATKYL